MCMCVCIISPELKFKLIRNAGSNFLPLQVNR